ncbi:MAG: GNAT family N-acetyltransferase [Ruminococcus flavefaciens]|nr:GNAT family N-acetyltransferase [Ruminococcus flavefaciens]MCM1228614.1 GNAT family N-acetyltransferase [Ruminococcus flavefaciens]
MDFKLITSESDEWTNAIEFADTCSWRAGKFLADRMRRNCFSDWERVIIAKEQNNIAGYCTVAKTDCIPELPYTPYICFIFVSEEYRGNRLSEKMIIFATSYLKNLGFDKVYLVSDHINLYEKYGFEVIDRQPSPWGEEEKIYMQSLN